MRELVIKEIRQLMFDDPDLDWKFDLDSEELDHMSNQELLDLLIEILVEE